MIERFDLDKLVVVADTTPTLIKNKFAGCHELAITLKQCIGNNITLIHGNNTFVASKSDMYFKAGDETTSEEDTSVCFTFKNSNQQFILGSDCDTDLMTKRNGDTTFWFHDQSFVVDMEYTEGYKPAKLKFDKGTVVFNTAVFSDIPISEVVAKESGWNYRFADDDDNTKAISIAPQMEAKGCLYEVVDKIYSGGEKAILYKDTSSGEHFIAFYTWSADKFCRFIALNSNKRMIIDNLPNNIIRLYCVLETNND